MPHESYGGGSWYAKADGLTSYERYAGSSDQNNYDKGFRVARTLSR